MDTTLTLDGKVIPDIAVAGYRREYQGVVDLIGEKRFREIIGENVLVPEFTPEEDEKLFEYYLEDMPYGTAKARTGDPTQFVYERLCRLGKIFGIIDPIEFLILSKGW